MTFLGPLPGPNFLWFSMFFEVTFGSLSVPKGILGLILGGTEKRRKKGLETVRRILRKGGGAL